MAYVKTGSKNHKLMKELASATEEKDQMLYELGMPMGAVLDHEEQEFVMIVKRQYADHVWDLMNMTGLDKDPIVWPSNPTTKPWKRKVLREWIIENSYPTFNYRLRNERGGISRFPWYKYFGAPNNQGVGLVVVNMTETDIEMLQIRMITTLRPYIEKLVGKFRFTIIERSEYTLPARQGSKLGLDDSLQAELVLIENPQTVVPRVKIDNYWHGNPTKYRCQNFTKEPLAEFFDNYHAKKLPTYWASRQVGSAIPEQKGDAIELTSDTYQSEIMNGEKTQAAFVAFFNMDIEEGCKLCAERREIWKKVAKKIKSKKLFKNTVIAHIDQSDNEHPENRVAQRLSEPVIMWYPPGRAKRRWKNRNFLHDISMNWNEEEMMEKLANFMEDKMEEEL